MSRKRPKPLPVNEGRRTRVPPSDSTPPQLRHAAFCLRCDDNKFCLAQCERADKIGFVDKIHSLSGLTWNEIMSSDRHAMGFEKIERNQIKKKPPKSVTEDVQLIAFRYKDKKAMIGYRDENEVFQILWFDAKFKLYDHG